MECTSSEFDNAVQPYLTEFGFAFEYGSLTDVGELKCNGLKVCTFNLAAGYLRAHSDTEVVDVHRFEDSIELLFKIIDNLGGQVWEHTPSAYGYGGYGGYGGWEQWSDQDSYPSRGGGGKKKSKKKKAASKFDKRELLSLDEFYDPTPCNKAKCRASKGPDVNFCPSCNVYKKIPDDLLEKMRE